MESNEFVAVDAEALPVPSGNGHYTHTGRAAITRTFKYRDRDNPQAPVEEIELRPYAVSQANLDEMMERMKEAQNILTQADKYKERLAELEADLTIAEIEQEQESVIEEINRKMAAYQSKIDELGRHATPTEILADEFFLRTVVRWNVKDGERLIPLTREGIASLDTVKAGALRDWIVGFIRPAGKKAG